MDTLARAAMPPLPDLTGRSFALLDQAERERLGRLFRPLAWIDGLIAAEAIAPSSPDEADDVEGALGWLHLIWSEERLDEVDKLTPLQTVEVVTPMMDHYCHVAAALFEEGDAYRPYLAGYRDPLEAASQWAEGFCGGLSLHIDAWEPLLADEKVRLLLVAVFSLVREEDMPEHIRADSPFRGMPPEQLKQVRRSTVEMLPEIVHSLHDRLLGHEDDSDIAGDGIEGPRQPHLRAASKVGRNDPCPCGSGKKYKKCCLE